VLRFRETAVREIIRGYTREAGLRNLERELATVCRKVAKQVAEGFEGFRVVGKDAVGRYLGARRYLPEVTEAKSEVGVATGLAWTPEGGEILHVEASLMPGGKTLNLTGHLGEVMKESAQAALSYLRSRAGRLGIPEDFFERSDIHLHVPSGAIPKDGPSAGVAMVASLASLLSGKPVRRGVAMTGEITLRGKVLPVGGIRQKVMAASRAHVQTVLLPRQNAEDLSELPEEVTRNLEFLFLDTVDDVLSTALTDGEPQRQTQDPKKQPRTAAST
jgi:ATP-dependent Lon protease